MNEWWFPETGNWKKGDMLNKKYKFSFKMSKFGESNTWCDDYDNSVLYTWKLWGEKIINTPATKNTVIMWGDRY